LIKIHLVLLLSFYLYLGSFQQRGAIDCYIGEKQFDDKNYGEVNFRIGVLNTGFN
jgi:hypothetical protein